MRDKLLVGIFTSLPHHLISRFVGLLAHSKISWVKKLFIQWFVKRYGVDMTQADQPDPLQYENFNAFFTRELAQGVRPIAPDPIVCPVDGGIYEVGHASQGKLLQAKGAFYDVASLLGGQRDQFQDASFATLYLAPKDYHRIHMPVTGRLTKMIHVPGRLFSVSPSSVKTIPNLFARNERVIAFFETEFGPMAMVLVGAMIVASIVTKWKGVITPTRTREIQKWTYDDQAIEIKKGEEMGQFMLGSTVIVLFQNSNIEWLATQGEVKMGQKFGKEMSQ